MKAEERTNRILFLALGKTTALPREGTDLTEFLRFECTFLKKNRELFNKPISYIFQFF